MNSQKDTTPFLSLSIFAKAFSMSMVSYPKNFISSSNLTRSRVSPSSVVKLLKYLNALESFSNICLSCKIWKCSSLRSQSLNSSKETSWSPFLSTRGMYTPVCSRSRPKSPSNRVCISFSSSLPFPFVSYFSKRLRTTTSGAFLSKKLSPACILDKSVLVQASLSSSLYSSAFR